ncbi:hypothetical protein IJI18_00695 [Candidatus Saccharibacteria bacterium]|nr:hypothetical protein [Candidatus Saccharibacteria bacterium]
MDLQPNKIDGKVLPVTNRRISAAEWNQLVGSCMAFITAAGFTPDGADNQQFLNAFKAIAADLELVGANTNLSNLSAQGQAKLDAKADASSAYMRAFTPLNVTIACGNAGIAGTYTLSQLPNDNTIRLGLFMGELFTSTTGNSSMTVSTDVCTSSCTIACTNNGFVSASCVLLPIKQTVTIGFPSIAAGVENDTKLKLLGYF